MPETELKLMIAKAELAKLEKLPLLREGIGTARRRRLKSAYFWLVLDRWDLHWLVLGYLNLGLDRR